MNLFTAFVRFFYETPDEDTGRVIVRDALDEDRDCGFLAPEFYDARRDWLAAVVGAGRRTAYAIGRPESAWLKANLGRLLRPLADAVAVNDPRWKERLRYRRTGRKVKVRARVPHPERAGATVWGWSQWDVRRGLVARMEFDADGWRAMMPTFQRAFPEAECSLLGFESVARLVPEGTDPHGDWMLAAPARTETNKWVNYFDALDVAPKLFAELGALAEARGWRRRDRFWAHPLLVGLFGDPNVQYLPGHGRAGQLWRLAGVRLARAEAGIADQFAWYTDAHRGALLPEGCQW